GCWGLAADPETQGRAAAGIADRPGDGRAGEEGRPARRQVAHRPGERPARRTVVGVKTLDLYAYVGHAVRSLAADLPADPRPDAFGRWRQADAEPAGRHVVVAPYRSCRRKHSKLHERH